MRVVIQRVKEAQVVVDGETTGAIAHGLLVLCGIHEDDDDAAAEWCARKLTSIRLWQDDGGKQWARGVGNGGLLLVSQFTLFASLKGNKPDFHRAMGPTLAQPFWERFVARVQALHKGPVQQGRFGAKMAVTLCNDGPVTIILDSPTSAPAPAPAPAPASAPAPAVADAPVPPPRAPCSKDVPLALVLIRPAHGASTPMRMLEERGMQLVALKLTRTEDAGGALAAVVRPRHRAAAGMGTTADLASALLLSQWGKDGEGRSVQVSDAWREHFEESELHL